MATNTTNNQCGNIGWWWWWWRYSVCRIDWRWGSFLTAAFLSFLILSAAAIAQKSGDSITAMDLVRTGLYLGWIVAMGLFVKSNYSCSCRPFFFMRALFHLTCAALTLRFICSVGQITSDHLHIWIPVSATCGVFIAFSIITSGSWFCGVIKAMIIHLLGATTTQRPPRGLLPMHRPDPALDSHSD